MLEVFLGIPQDILAVINQGWAVAGYGPLSQYAPFAAHVLSVELFFQFALGGNHIGTGTPSNRIDISYLNYLPFSMMFVSSDNLHRRCAPLFLREDQEFVWGPELKQDLARINAHFLALPDSEKDRGVMQFASKPPKLEGSIVRRLRERFLRPGYDDEPEVEPSPIDDKRTEQLAAHIKRWTDAEAAPQRLPPNDADIASIAIRRSIRKRKGSWWQAPKDLPDDPDNRE